MAKKNLLKDISIEFMPQMAEVEIYYKTKIKAKEQPRITSSTDIRDYLRQIWNPMKIEYVEEMMIIVLNRANHILGWAKVSQGGLAGTVVDAKVIFQIALKANASAIIISHNHPSGNLKPSSADISLTKKIVEAGKNLDLPLLDHIIMASDSYYSFADEGML
jgi:DNA repair protein RadC